MGAHDDRVAVPGDHDRAAKRRFRGGVLVPSVLVPSVLVWSVLVPSVLVPVSVADRVVPELVELISPPESALDGPEVPVDGAPVLLELSEPEVAGGFEVRPRSALARAS